VEKTLIKNVTVITVDVQDRIIEQGSILIEGDRIVGVGKSDDQNLSGTPDVVIDGTGRVAIPGLVNTHMHSGMTRGSSDFMQVYDWLKYYVNPIYAAASPEDCYVSALLSYSEGLKSGVTCVLDMYRHMDRIADAAKELGIRCCLAPSVAESTVMDRFPENLDLVRERNGDANGRINIWIGFHGWKDCSAELMRKAREAADKYRVRIHTHTNESSKDHILSRKRHQREPLEYLRDNGIIGKDVVLAHCCWLTDKEIAILEDSGTNVAHCPISNMKLADGVAPVTRLLSENINVSLGTDGINESNTFDMFRVMHEAALLHRIHQMNATIMPPKEVLRMATVNGAKSLGLEREIGSIEQGKKADIVLLDFAQVELAPLHFGELSNVLSIVVYSACGRDVETVLVDGKVVVDHGKLKNANEDVIIEKSRVLSMDLLERRKQFIGMKTGMEEDT
jgi:5-methylthioadenosine/S-adenosylhomocysteine deaminase